MRPFFIASILILAGLSAHAQQIKFSAPDPLLHGWMTTDIRSSPGIAADNYYVVYRDFGGKWDLKHHIDTYLKIYSLKQGNLVSTVYLNPLLAQDAKNVSVDRVVLWKDHLLVLYTEKKGKGDTFRVSGQLLDLNAKTAGAPVVLGYLPKRYYPVTVSSRPSPVFNGKEGRVQANGLRWAFNSDSSQMAVYVLSKDPARPARFVLVDPALQVTGRIDCDLAAGPGSVSLVGFRQYQEGKLYALVCRHKQGDRKNGTYDLVETDPVSGEARRLPLTLPGAVILDAVFTFNGTGDVIVTGSYHDGSGSGRPQTTQGVFALTVTGGKLMRTTRYAFTPGLVQQLGGKLAASKDKGLSRAIWICKLLPLPGNRIAVIGQSRTSAVQRVGMTTAMHQYFDANGNLLFYEIASSGKIAWAAGIKRSLLNLELAVRTAPIFFDGTTGKVQVLYDAEKEANHYKPAIFLDTYGRTGPAASQVMAVEGSKQGRHRILWGTARRVGTHRVVATYYDAPKNQMGTVDISFSRPTDLFTKSGTPGPEQRPAGANP